MKDKYDYINQFPGKSLLSKDILYHTFIFVEFNWNGHIFKVCVYFMTFENRNKLFLLNDKSKNFWSYKHWRTGGGLGGGGGGALPPKWN